MKDVVFSIRPVRDNHLNIMSSKSLFVQALCVASLLSIGFTVAVLHFEQLPMDNTPSGVWVIGRVLEQKSQIQYLIDIGSGELNLNVTRGPVTPGAVVIIHGTVTGTEKSIKLEEISRYEWL